MKRIDYIILKWEFSLKPFKLTKKDMLNNELLDLSTTRETICFPLALCSEYLGIVFRFIYETVDINFHVQNQ